MILFLVSCYFKFREKKKKSLPLHEKPVPEYSGLQVQVKLPIVFVQIASA